MEIEEFDIEKVEALDYDHIKKQLCYIFKSDDDITNFIAFLENVSRFVNLSNDKRHMTLIELGYFKSQIQLFDKKIESLLARKKNEQVRNAIKKAKDYGEKITENMVTYYSENNDVMNALEDLHNLVFSWSTYMNDLYFMCSQTSKNLGSFS